MKLKKILIIIALIIINLTLVSCNGASKEQKEAAEPTVVPIIEDKQEQAENAAAGKEEPVQEQIDLQKIKPNENGKIMILMYHGIDKEEKEWVRTPENFRRDLQTLYDNGYRIISLRDYVTNNIKVEAGYTPVVLTFDDGLKNQFNYIEENGTKILDPDCAVGIMESFYKEHPDFGRAASFFVYYPVPFRQKELIAEKYEYLINNGYEIGNHGYNHENLGQITIEEVQKALTLNVVNTQKYIKDYDVFSLALPYGAAPSGDNYRYVASGEYDGQAYNHRAVLLVGSSPAPAPNNVKFDSARLPRVRASEMKTAGTGIYDWLEHFEKKPNERYISDGNPNTISIPEEELSKTDQDSVKDKKIITYKIEQ